MSRSLKIDLKFNAQVKSALKRSGFPSQNALAMELGLSRSTVNNFMTGKPVDYLCFVEICEKLGLDWKSISTFEDSAAESGNHQKDWGNAPDISIFYGRTEELARLEQWIVKEKCRIVTLSGMGGIGKTSLAVKLAGKIQDKFEYVIWRSLHYTSSILELLAELIEFLSNGEQTNLPETANSRITCLIEYLQQHRCLLVLDDWDEILVSSDTAGQYRQGYEDYRSLLKRVGEEQHQSCLLITSLDRPLEISLMSGKTQPVRSIQLGSLGEAAKEIFREKGLLEESRWQTLIEFYCGNPLCLNLVSTRIRDVFDGKISEFFDSTLVFREIRNLLDAHFERLSDLEKEIMYRLAQKCQPVALRNLRKDLTVSGVTDAVDSLLRRSLIEKIAVQDETRFTLQSVVMEYVTELLEAQLVN